jgi:2-(1,2-epoxy-1,2-dihydrophenyl)acetyl-CoA isomerase
MPVGVLGRVKRLINQAFTATLMEQLGYEQAELNASANSPEGREGLAAFLEKRTANFSTGETTR